MRGWLRETVDERLLGLFSEQPELIQKTVGNLVHECLVDPEIEEMISDTLAASIESGNDETTGTVWLAVILGEVRSQDAVGSLVQALTVDDEMLQAAAARSLRRIGARAFEMLLDVIADDEVDPDMFVVSASCLRGLTLYNLPELQDRAESLLRQYLVHVDGSRDGLRRAEAAALALARLGVADARELVEHALKTAGGNANGFLEDALEMMDEHPDGIPVSDREWDDEFRWALGPVIPGGELADREEDE